MYVVYVLYEYNNPKHSLQEPGTDSLKIELLLELAEALYNAGFSVRRCMQPIDWAIDIILVSSFKSQEAPTVDSEKTKLTEISAGERALSVLY